MLYQKLLMGDKPYFLMLGNAAAFESHRHPEIEISFCLEGSYDLVCENQRYTLNRGDFAVIPSMAAHEIPENNDISCKSLTIELGYILLGAFFDTFTALTETCCWTKSACAGEERYQQLSALLVETAGLYTSDSPFRELFVKSNLFQISALLLQLLDSMQPKISHHRNPQDIEKIDKALHLIYSSYNKPLNIRAVSKACGYSESNFCKTFKSITGITFHHMLNRHRIDIACTLLRESGEPIEKIAQETGFADSKSFCRVFKKYTSQSASEYRSCLQRSAKEQ